MEFQKILKHRRMVRHYEPDPVPHETLERIVRTVLWAPTGGYAVVAGVTIGKVVPDARANETLSRFRGRRRSLEEVIRWER